MTNQDFYSKLSELKPVIELIKDEAHEIHQSVNQTYDKVHPYGFHLDMVASFVFKYASEVCSSMEDILPIVFAAFFHDSIEDARLTYNDVTEIAEKYMNPTQAFLAAEIVYALTNDKGRTRKERAGDKYYKGIRSTPYAPCVKLADRLANTYYSYANSNPENSHMKDVYKAEMPHFLQQLKPDNNDDIRFELPQKMIDELKQLIA